MDYSCSKDCMHQWKCSWCYCNYCDDVCSPYLLEGKPTFWSERDACKNDKFKEYWDKLSEKQRNKVRRENLAEPIYQTFYLCDECKNKYIENNICKGRRPDKIGRKKGY